MTMTHIILGITLYYTIFKNKKVGWDFPGGPMVKWPSKTGNMGLIPGWGADIPHAMGHLSPRSATTEPAYALEPACRNQSSLHATAKSPHTATKT